MNSFRLFSLAVVFTGLVFVSSVSAQNVSVVAGNGQVLGAQGGNFVLQPLVVQVTDATTGLPVGAGVPVNWQGFGINGVFLATFTNQYTAATDVNGQSSAIYSLSPNVPTFDVTSPFIQTSVTATAGNTATFTLTQMAAAPQVPVPPSLIVTQTGNGIPFASTLQGAIGTTAPPIQFQVQGTNGQSTRVLPNVAVELLNFQDPSQGPAVACATSTSSAGVNTALTDATGIVSCTPLFGGLPGSGQFILTVGGVSGVGLNSNPAGFWEALLDPTDANSFPPVTTAWGSFIPTFKIKATAGAPGSIKIVSPAGGTQSVTAGTQVSLTVETDNTAGLPSPGATVTWTVVPTSSGASVATATTTSGPFGQSVNTLTIPSAVSGAVQVTAAVPNAPPVTFNISVSPPVTVTQFQIVSGGNQSAIINTSFGQPLVVKVTTSAGVASGIPVQFQVLSGSVSLSATTVSTDTNGIAQVSVTAGSVPGPASVVATLASTLGINTISFALTVLPTAPAITAANFVNGADYQANSLSPCGLGALVTNVGTLGVSSISPTFPGGPVPSSAVQLTFGNVGAPIIDIGSNALGQQQVLFQVPCEVTPGSSVPVALTVGGAVTNVNLNVQPASPGVFQTQMSDGVLRAVLVRPDGSYVSLSNPARLGEIVVSYVTGLGATTPGVSTRSLPNPSSSATAVTNAMVLGTVVPGMAGGGANLVYAKLSEDIPGVYVVAFQIPSNAPTGNDIVFSIGLVPAGSSTAYYSAASKIPVHQ